MNCPCHFRQLLDRPDHPISSRTAAPPINPLHLTPTPYIPVFPPHLTLAAGTKYHRSHPQQSAGHNPLSSTLPPHQPAGYLGFPLSCHPTNRRKPQPCRLQPCPTPQSLTLPAAAWPSSIIPLATSRTAAPHTPVSLPSLNPAAGPKYHRPHPQQSAGHSPLSSIPSPHQPAGHTVPPLSCHPSRPGRKHQ